MKKTLPIIISMFLFSISLFSQTYVADSDEDQKINQGIYYNLGIAKILTIDSEIEEKLFGDESIDVYSTFSIGYGIRL